MPSCVGFRLPFLLGGPLTAAELDVEQAHLKSAGSEEGSAIESEKFVSVSFTCSSSGGEINA